MMSAKAISGLDLLALLREFKVLEGARIDKIYHKERKLIIHAYKSGDKKYRLFLSSGKAFLTKYKRDMPEKPSNFCMTLRKYLSGNYIQKVGQRGMDRILQIETERYKLVCELFGSGNFVLVSKDSNEIEAVMEAKDWKDRSLFRGENYQYPPGTDSIYLDYDAFKEIKKLDKIVVKALAADMSLGGKYAEEICQRAQVAADTLCQELNESQLHEIHQTFTDLVDQLKQGELAPQIVYKEERPFEVLPLSFSRYNQLGSNSFSSFSQALDTFFTERAKAKIKEQREQVFKDKLEDLEERKRRQETKLEGLKQAVDDNKDKADALYESYSLVDNIIATLRKAIKQLSNDELKDKLEAEADQGVTEAQMIEDINLANKEAVVDVGQRVRIEFDQNVEKNAEMYYEKSKQAKKKIKGAKESLEKTKDEIEELKQNKSEIDLSEEYKDVEKKKQSKKWYQKFRWFFSSANTLVIGGRDATTNDMIVKKYTESNEVLFHADVKGAPFITIKQPRQEVNEQTMQEAATFGVANSSCWKQQMGSADIYAIKPEQAVKVPGLPTGAFQIQGERNYFRNVPLELAVGVYVREEGGERELLPMCGPVPAVEHNCQPYVTIRPAKEKKSACAKQIKRFFEQETDTTFDLDRIMRALPPGGTEIVDRCKDSGRDQA